MLTVAVLAWALLNIIPTDDTPFDSYILEEVTAETDAFNDLYAEAETMVDSGEAPSLFMAFRQLGREGDVDYQVFFPHINVIDVKNRVKRNDILINEVLKRSKGNIKRGLDLMGGISVTFSIADPNFRELPSFEQEEQLTKVISILRQRLDGSGVAEPIIRSAGEGRVEVQMPGLSTRDNPEIIDTISKPARLEFRLVNRQTPVVSPEMPADQIPSGFEILALEREDRRTGEIYESYYLIKRLPEATGDIIERSYPAQNDSGQFEVQLSFTGEGSSIFEGITRQMTEQNRQFGGPGQLAIVLDGQLQSAPSVNEVISSRAVISGEFNQRDAIDLANVLNNPLDVPLEVAEMYEVGPSLAEDAREASVNASLYGAMAVVIFMVVYYFAGGVVAVFAGLANIIIVLGILASLNATVTLPGVAALVLTLGMGVDANILIFERMREELKLGKSIKAAVQGGFDKAFSTIVDANVTTLITAIILINLGTGPVKGFGTTLAIGICASVFCALIVTRFILDLMVALGMKKLLGMPGFNFQGFDFLGKRKVAFAASWVIVLIGVVSVVANRDSIFGIDFTGGDEVTLSYESAIASEDISTFARENNFGEVISLYSRDLGTGEQILKIQTEFGQGQAMADALSAQFAESGITVKGVSQIGASVSGDIQMNAILSVLAALVGILLYVAIRFEVGYGIGAVVATIHDVLMTIGIFVLFGGFLSSGQFTAPMLAAILMIVGYSINDTIVVFDRIREELQLNPEMKLYKVINLSINRVLSRSILTSITTLLASFALYIFGAGVINDFAFVFIVGILTGTFSSVFIASPIFYWWHKGDRRHVEEREIVPKRDWEVSTREARGEA